MSEAGLFSRWGGGIGAIEIDLLKAGARRAVNVELTPTYEDTAGELLFKSGFAHRVVRKVMDFTDAGAEIETADIVVMNRGADQPSLVAAEGAAVFRDALAEDECADAGQQVRRRDGE